MTRFLGTQPDEEGAENPTVRYALPVVDEETLLLPVDDEEFYKDERVQALMRQLIEMDQAARAAHVGRFIQGTAFGMAVMFVGRVIVDVIL